MRVVVTKLTNKLVSCAAQSVPNGPVSAETLTFGPGRRALLDFRPTSTAGHKMEKTENERLLTSMIAQLSVSEARHTEVAGVVANVILAQQAMTVAIKERDDRRDVSVSTYDEVLRNSCHDAATRRRFLKLQMLPLEFARRVLSATTPELISINDQIITLAIKLLSWTVADSYKRDEISRKLEKVPEAGPWIYLWLLKGKLEPEIAYLLALELVILELKLPKTLRQKVIVTSLAVDHPTEHTETHAAANKVKSAKKEVDGLFLSFTCADVAQGTFPAPPPSLKKKDTWQTGGAPQRVTPPTTTGRSQALTRKKGKAVATRHVSGGGGPLLVPDPVDEEEPAGTGVPPAFAAFQTKHRSADAKPLPAAVKSVEKAAMPVEKRTTGSAAPFLKDMRPGALVTDWILDVVIRGIVRITGNNVAVIFPGTLQRWLAQKSEEGF